MQTSLLQSFARRFLDRDLQPRELLSLRKILYGVLILVLFTGAFFWRRDAVEAQATQLALREESHGELKLSRSVLRLTLTGFQGLATCSLWMSAMDKQKKNQWNELEYRVRVLTNLQPHFITPWLFQSWNLAYNVSVESDRPKDKYFYMTRGIELLAEGERQNHNNPDIRFSVGFYLQHKICNSDETNVIRSLFQLSCIPPNERDPARFRDPATGEINLVAFEKFCKDHPKLIRRLRDGLRKDTKGDKDQLFTCEKVEAVINFLDENFRVPSQWQEEPTPAGVPWRADKVDPRKDKEDHFPVLPPRRDSVPAPQRKFQPGEGLEELDDSNPLDDNVDGFLVARSWFSYSQEPLPDPGDLPGQSVEITDRELQHKPRNMTTLLFRSQPALTQYHRSESLQTEGWFDATPWVIKDWFNQNRFADGEPAKVSAKGEDHSLKAWEDAVKILRKHGDSNHLYFRPLQEGYHKEIEDKANRYWLSQNLPVGAPPERPTNVDPRLPGRERERQMNIEYELIKNSKPTPEQREEYTAARFMYEYKFYRELSNFPQHLSKSEVEAEKETVDTRRLIYDAETARLNGDALEALRIYNRPDCLKAWRDNVLSVPNPSRHREYRDNEWNQETTFEIQLKYLELINKFEGREAKQELELWSVLYRLPAHGQRIGGGCLPTELLAFGWVGKLNEPGTLAMFRGPFNVLVVEKTSTPTIQQAKDAVALFGNPLGAGPLLGLGTLQVQAQPLLNPTVVRRVLDRHRILLPPAKDTKGPPSPPRQPNRS